MAAKGMQVYPVNLAANVTQSFNLEGDFFHVFEAADPLFLQFDDGRFFEVAQGVGMRVIYQRVTLRSATSQAVKIALGFGYVNDARSSVAATITAPVEPAALNVPLEDVDVGAEAQELLAAAEASQLELVVGVSSDQPNGVRIGDDTTDATHGHLLEPGQSFAYATREALYAYNPDDSSTVTVTLLSMRSAP